MPDQSTVRLAGPALAASTQQSVDRAETGRRWPRPLARLLAHPAATTILAALGFIVLAGLFTWQLFTPNLADRRWVVAGDFSQQFYPFARYVADELAAGRLPLWNPFVFGGHPFQADPQTAVFYPVASVLALLLGRDGLSYRELEMELPVHFALAALGTFLFVRRITGSGLAALVAAIAFAFGGFLTSYPAQQLAILRTAAWLPWVLYCNERALGGSWHPRWLIGGAATLAVALLAGHSQTLLFIVYLAAAYALWRGLDRGHGWRRAVAAVLLPPVLAGGLAAVQLVPTGELVAMSTRDRLPYDAAAYGYELKALFGALLPGWRGEKALYVGAGTLSLAALALTVRRPRGALTFWAAVAVVGLILSVGGHTFLYRLLFLGAPGWATFRDQERVAAVWSFAVVVLAAYGTAVLIRDGPPRHWQRWLTGSAVLTWLFAAQVVVLWTGSGGAADNPYDSLLDGAVFLGLVLSLAAALAWAWPRVPAAAAGTLLLALLAFDLFSVNADNNLTRDDPSRLLERAGALAMPRAESEPYRLRADDDRAVPPNLGMVWRTPFMDGDSPIQLRRTNDLLASGEEWRLWQLFNVKYLLSVGDREDPGLEFAARADGLDVLRVRYSLPRAWAVSDVRLAPDASAALGMVLSPDIHPGDVAIVEEVPPLRIETGLPRPEVRVRRYEPQQIELEVSSRGNALVVVADSWHPGWRAWVNDVPAPILRTNYAFRGVPVAAGEHLIVMRYQPVSFAVGGIVSGASLIFALGLLWWLGRRSGALRAGPARVGSYNGPDARKVGPCCC